MQLEVIETGGTINGILDPLAPPPTASRVVYWLTRHAQRLGLDLSSRIVALKDSRALEEADRQQLCGAITDSAARRILIPHGTYTMPETGTYLRRHLSAETQARSIVLVGSQLPLGVAGSDAPAALEYAIATLREEPVGVWIAMGGRLWDPRRVIKDPVTGQYVAREGEADGCA